LSDCEELVGFTHSTKKGKLYKPLIKLAHQTGLEPVTY